MRQQVNGVVFDTDRLKASYLWLNDRAPDDPRYQRYIVYRITDAVYIVWVRTGALRGHLNQLLWLNREDVTTLYRATAQGDRRRSLRPVIQQLQRAA